MTTAGRIQCPWDWNGDPAIRSKADKLHSYVAMWAEPYEQEPPREADPKEYTLMRLSESRKLSELMAEAVAESVRDARREGASWDEIARTLGVSRQAVQKRFGGKR